MVIATTTCLEVDTKVRNKFTLSLMVALVSPEVLFQGIKNLRLERGSNPQPHSYIWCDVLPIELLSPLGLRELGGWEEGIQVLVLGAHYIK